MPTGDVTAATRLSSLPIQCTQANKMPIFTIIVTYLPILRTHTQDSVLYTAVHKGANDIHFILKQ